MEGRHSMKRQQSEASRNRGGDYVWAGWMLMFGGIFSLTANGLATPLLPQNADFVEVASSPFFVIRQGLSALAAMFLTLGACSISGLMQGSGRFFGRLVNWLAIIGGVLLFAHEWGQIFFVHDLALVAPDALRRLEGQAGMNLFDIGAIAAIVGFSLGWLLYAMFLASVSALPRRGPLLIITGFFAIPTFTLALPGLSGMILGNLILSGGWILAGHDARRI